MRFGIVLTALVLLQGCSDQGPTSTTCRSGAPRPVAAADSSVHWTLVSSPTKQRLSGVTLAGPTTGAAVGDSGTYLIFGGGSVWSPLNLAPWNTKDFYSVQETDSGAVWIAADSGLIIFAPTRLGGWSQQTTTVLVTLFSVSRIASSFEMFAAGTDRVIVHILDGFGNFAGPWSSQLSPVGDTLFFIGGPSDSAVLAVGQGGAAARFNGTTWAPDTIGVSVDIRSATFVGNPLTDVWLVGDHGTILHSPTALSSSWSAQPSGTAENLFGVTADSATRAFAVGSGGTILHWDGSVWRQMVSPTSAALRSIAHGYAGSVDYWAVGDCGTILHGTP